MTYQIQDIIVNLRGIVPRIEQIISQLSDLSANERSSTDDLRALTALVERTLAIWNMSDSEVAEQHLLNTYDRPRERMMDLMCTELKKQIEGKYK